MKIVDFTQKLDDKTGKTSPNTLLEAAKDQLSKVLVLGIALDGSLYVSSSMEDKPDILYLIEQFKFDLLIGDFDFDLDGD
jgi:hypothetical protein